MQLLRGSPAAPVGDLRDDSRQVRPGDLFIARTHAGTAAPNATEHLREALSRGATAVLVSAGHDAALFQAFPDAAVVCAPRGQPVNQAMSGTIAERFFDLPSRRLRLIGVTGTNGKTTITLLIQHLLHRAGLRCGVIGTVWLDDGAQRTPADLTTPGAIELSRWLAHMAGRGCGAVAAEFSSHGLDQGRTDALSVAGGVFTNLTGDHLDYHGDMASYARAKARLFSALGPDAFAVVNADDPASATMLRDCVARAIPCCVEVGASPAAPQHAALQTGAPPAGVGARARVLRADARGSRVRMAGPWGEFEAALPLVGRHNVYNALEALAAAWQVAPIPLGELAQAVESLPHPPGRLERVPSGEGEPTVLVDYAHTHDALENVLGSLRSALGTQGSTGRLVCVFGCGGDRDRTKRPKMAAVACRWADRVLITSDNPRTEEPARIFADILGGLPAEPRAAVTVEPDRRAAIRLAIAQAQAGDVVLLAGKGHEDYQIIGTTKHPFDDRVVQAPLRRPGRGLGRPA